MERLFEGLKKGMREIIAHKEGKITLKSEFIQIPEPQKNYEEPAAKLQRIKKR